MRFRINDPITWGTGDIRAQFMGYLPYRETHCRAILSEDYRSPCGHVWPAGKIVEIPIEEIRTLQ